MRKGLAMAVLTSAIVLPGTGMASDLGKVPMNRNGSAAPSPWVRYPDWVKTDFSNFNNLADLKRSPPAPKVGSRQPLPANPGDPVAGKKLAFSRDRGSSCVTCHVMGPDTPEMPGNVGPDLSEYGNTQTDAGYVFNYIYDPRQINPASMMLPWGTHGFYSPEEIRDITAFVLSLKKQAEFKNPLDNPANRPLPIEDRDWHDPFVNPAAGLVETGAERYGMPGVNGKSCAGCHEKPEIKFKKWAVTMPKWDPVMKHPVGVEEFVYRHASATMGESWLMQSSNNIEMAVYLRWLANGEKFDIDVKSKPMKDALERGKKLTTARIGQLNLSCVDCHSPDRGGEHWVRGQYLGSTKGQIDHFPTWRTSRYETWDIRKRFEWCNVQIRANELPPDALPYDDLEVYLTAISNGMPMQVPGIRH